MFSRQIFAKSGRFREIPCVFPYDQGILHVSGRELIRGKPPKSRSSGERAGSKITHHARAMRVPGLIRGIDLAHEAQAATSRTSAPSPSISTRTESRGLGYLVSTRLPRNTNAPFWRPRPREARELASQASASKGWPRIIPPA